MSRAYAPDEHRDETENVESVQSFDQLVSGRLQELVTITEQGCAQVAQATNWNEKDTLALFIGHFYIKVHQDLSLYVLEMMLMLYSIFSLNTMIISLLKIM
jgi:hypothetical protein